MHIQLMFEWQSVSRKAPSRPKLEPHYFLRCSRTTIKKCCGDKLVFGCFFEI